MQTTDGGGKKSLQELLEEQPDGGSLTLPLNEEANCAVVIRRALTLVGNGATIWALQGPVITIESGAVTLRNLGVEVTGELGQATPEQQCAILVNPQAQVTFENVRVKGTIIGVAGEEGFWDYPQTINLGELPPNQTYVRELEIEVPVSCKITSGVSPVEVKPDSLAPGRQKVRLHVEALAENSRLNGNLFLETPSVMRRIFLQSTGRLVLPPEVMLFAPEPPQVAFGRPAMLVWKVMNATELSIDQGVGKVSLTGSCQVDPTSTTMYTLWAKGLGGSVSKTATVIVLPPPAPSIAQFIAQPTAISPGEEVSLLWTVTNANQVMIDQGIGNVQSIASRPVKPTRTTTYTLTATGLFGTPVKSAVTVNVQGTQPVAVQPTRAPSVPPTSVSTPVAPPPPPEPGVEWMRNFVSILPWVAVVTAALAWYFEASRWLLAIPALLGLLGILRAGIGRLVSVVALGFVAWGLYTSGERFDDLRLLESLTVDDAALSVAFPMSGRAVAAGFGNAVALWDLKAGYAKRILKRYDEPTLAIAVSPDGKILASTWAKTAILWEVKSVSSADFKQALPRDMQKDLVTSLAFGDNNTLATGSRDNTVVLWDLQAVKPRQTLSAHGAAVTSVAFSGDGKVLASGGEDSKVILWDSATGEAKWTQRHLDSVLAVAVSADGTVVASGGADNIVRLWDARTGQSTGMLQGHTKPVRAVAFSRKGGTLASASDDETIRLWEVSTGKSKQTLQAQQPAAAVAFSPDGKTLVTGSLDKTVKLWRAK